MYLLDYLIVIRLSECDDMFHPLTSTRDSPYDTIAMRACRAHYPDERMYVVAFASELAAGILQLLIFSLVPFVW